MLRTLILAAFLAIGLTAAAEAKSQATPAQSALIIDLGSGAILLEKEADVPLPPASMSKLMTLYMVFEALDRGLLSMSDEFRISQKASEMGGSKMFIREGEVVSIENLLRGVIIQSGNDAAVVLGEALLGTEEAFAQRMTVRAAELGMANSTFANATGWPDPNHLMSARDLATIATRLVTDFPQYYGMFAETEFTWDGIVQQNRNPLLGLGIGADGLKTGHTEEAGYGLVASAKRGDRRIVMVITGLESASARRTEAERLLNWAFRAFETKSLYRAGDHLVEAPVWIGDTSTVSLAASRDVMVTAPLGTLDQISVKAAFETPIPAPVVAGQEVGHLVITVPDLAPVKVPLVTLHGVEEGGFVSRVKAAAISLLSEIDLN